MTGASARLAAAFSRARAESRPAFISYMTPGFPTLAEMDPVFDALVEGGSDLVEVGIPFSDPLADGTTVQRTSFEALKNGITPTHCLEFAQRARSRHPAVPFIFFTYMNPVLQYGLERFGQDAAAAGADGVLLVDLPPEEAGPAREAMTAAGLDLIFLVAPTSSEARLELICSQSSGFIYCVSVAGVTGAREGLPPDLKDFISRVRRCTNLPLAVGFGLSRREHIEALHGIVDGVVVGSAILNVLGESPPEERTKAVREYVEVLSGRRRP